MLSRSRLPPLAVSRATSLARRFASTTTTVVQRRPKLVILGSGWGGFNLARKVDKCLYDVTVISPNSYFSFTPFLASTCVGTLEFRCATEPVRGIRDLSYLQGWAETIDFDKKRVKVGSALPPVKPGEVTYESPTKGAERRADYTPEETYFVEYDKLVIATGCRSASFNTPGVMEYARFLKDVREARGIRHQILNCLEQANRPGVTPEERDRLLTFRVVGAGPTGVEFAAELHDFVENDVYRLYPALRGHVKITLMDVSPGILMSFDANLRAYAEKKFARDGVDVLPNTKVTAVGPDWIETQDGKKLPYGLLVWNTGLQVNEFVHALGGVEKDTKAIKVDGHLRVINPKDGSARPDVYAIGDNATPADGNRLPATAQVASQMAGYMAKELNKLALGRPIDTLPDFRWKNMGSMVFIGDHKAMVDRSGVNIEGPRQRLSGLMAWLVWRSYYMTLAMSWRNKLLIPMYWALAYFFGRDVTNF